MRKEADPTLKKKVTFRDSTSRLVLDLQGPKYEEKREKREKKRIPTWQLLGCVASSVPNSAVTRPTRLKRVLLPNASGAFSARGVG